MTSFAHKVYECAICGGSVEGSILSSTKSFGSLDLDLRPPEMRSSTMDVWLQECLNCRYVNSDVSKAVNNAKAIMETDEYKSIVNDSSIPQLARRFAQYSLLQRTDVEASGIALIRAAWVSISVQN